MGEADIVISTPFSAETFKRPIVPIFAGTVDSVIKKYSDNIKDFTYLTPDLTF